MRPGSPTASATSPARPDPRAEQGEREAEPAGHRLPVANGRAALDNGTVISIELASALRMAGVRWQPRSGDRFAILALEPMGDVFTISEMTVEAHEFPSGTVLGFNGTTEWALDSVSKDEALWLPREDQLRAMLGGTFGSLVATEDSYEVTTHSPSGSSATFAAASADDAYARALLALVGSALDSTLA